MAGLKPVGDGWIVTVTHEAFYLYRSMIEFLSSPFLSGNVHRESLNSKRAPGSAWRGKIVDKFAEWAVPDDLFVLPFWGHFMFQHVVSQLSSSHADAVPERVQLRHLRARCRLTPFVLASMTLARQGQCLSDKAFAKLLGSRPRLCAISVRPNLCGIQCL